MASELARRLDIDKKLPSALLSYDVGIPAYEFICMYLIVQIVHEMSPDKAGFHHFPVKLARMLTGEEGNNKDYRRLNQAIDFLTDNNIKWNVAREDKTIDSFRASFIATKRVNSKSQNPSFRINEDIEELIKTTKVFSPMNLLMLVVFSHLRTAYPFYIFIKDAQARGATSLKIPLKQLKILFNVAENEYEGAFKHFNQIHIKPKSQFIKENSDVTFEYKNYREGRSVAGIFLSDIRKQEFQQVLFSKGDDAKSGVIEDIVALAHEIDSILKSSQDKISSDQYIRKLLGGKEPHDEATKALYTRYRKYGVTAKKLDPLLDNEAVGLRGLEEILDCCELDITKRKSTKNPIREPEKHVFWAINTGWKSEGYGLKHEEDRQEEDAKKERISKAREREREQLVSALQYHKAETEHHLKLNAAVNSLIKRAMSDEDKSEILENFGNTLQHKWEISDFENRGFETIAAKQSLGDFLALRYSVSLPTRKGKSFVQNKAIYDRIKNNAAHSSNLEKGTTAVNKDPQRDILEIVDTIIPAL